MSDTVNIDNKKSLKPLSPNGLSQVGGGGSEPPLTHNKVDCAYLPNEINSCANEVNEVCENDKLSLAKSSPHPNPLPRRGEKCHPGGFLDGRRVNESEPSPRSEQIEHTKTECLYAKLCEREGNPRQLVSGSYQPSDSTPDWSDSEHTQSSQDRNYGRFRMTNNPSSPPQAGVRT